MYIELRGCLERKEFLLLNTPLQEFRIRGAERSLASNETSLKQQYQEVKERHPNLRVLFRVGDFFELFGADAESAAPLLGLALTRRDKAVLMAGFPRHTLD